MKIAMIVPNDCNPDWRVLKEAMTLNSNGNVVRVYCLSKSNLPAREMYNGVEIIRLRYDPWKLLFARRYEKAATNESTICSIKEPEPAEFRERQPLWNKLFSRLHFYARPLLLHILFHTEIYMWKPEIVHAHDLPVLFAAYRLARKSGASLIYDAHELESDRNPPLTWLRRSFIKKYEGFIVRRAAAVITPSLSIAQHMGEIYGVRVPYVILNAPRVKEVDGDQEYTISPSIRSWSGEALPYQSVRDAAGAAAGELLGVFIGKVAAGRGIDLILETLLLTDFLFVTVGPIDQKYFKHIQNLSKNMGVDARWRHIDPVHPDDIIQFISTATFAFQSIDPTTRSYNWALPNKLFEAAFAGLPMVHSQAEEITRFVSLHGLGVQYEYSNPRSCARAIEWLNENIQKVKPAETKISYLMKQYSWSSQARVLLQIYDEVCGKQLAGPKQKPLGKREVGMRRVPR